MSMKSDAYRDFQYDSGAYDDDDENLMPYCSNENCEREDRLPDEPAGMQKVRDQILSWETVQGYHVPAEWSWTDEPFWKCPDCGTEYSLDDVQ